jgi:hypothetical protein
MKLGELLEHIQSEADLGTSALGVKIWSSK